MWRVNANTTTEVKMPTERVKHWVMTQERALQIYELIQTSLDPKTWEVIVKSENTKAPLGDFIDKAKKRIIFKPEFGNYSPSTVADDALTILGSLEVTFDQVRNRLEDSFRSILVVNEDMDQFIKGLESEVAVKEDENNALQNENVMLKDEIKLLKEEIRKKDAGIRPLTDVIRIRVNEIIKLYQQFKELIGDESEMKKFLPIFEKEVDTTIKLIEMRREQILSSYVDYTEPEVAEAVKSVDSAYKEPAEEVDEELKNLDDNAQFTGNMEFGEQEVGPEKPVGRELTSTELAEQIEREYAEEKKAKKRKK
jgi:hypothetical protein